MSDVIDSSAMSAGEVSCYTLPNQAELPENVAPWSFEPSRSALLIHDMQRYFLRMFPGEGDPVPQLIDNIASLRENLSVQGVPVFYTTQPGGMTSSERGLLQDFWGRGMTTSPRDRDVVDQLQPRDEDRVLTKWRYSGFHRTGLYRQLLELGRDQLVVCGVYAHVGVLATAVEAFTLDIQPFLVADATADFSRWHHDLALDYAAARCSSVTTTVLLTGRLPRESYEERI